MSAQKRQWSFKEKYETWGNCCFAVQPFSCNEFTAFLAFFDVSFAFLFTINRYQKRLELKQNRRLYLYSWKDLRLTKLGLKKWNSIFLLFLRKLRILLRVAIHSCYTYTLFEA